MFSLMFTDTIGIEKPTITKYHYEITLKKTNTINDKKSESYDLWTKDELNYIAKVDLSTPLEDDEDYSKW